MNSVLVVVGCVGFLGLIVTSIYETWLGVSLREPSMTRILFGASVSLKVLLIATMSWILYAIWHPATIAREIHGIEIREYVRALLYGGLLLQTTCVSIALYRWDRRAVRVKNDVAERQLVARQRELHERMEKRRARRDEED